MKSSDGGQINYGLVKQDNLVLQAIHFVYEQLPAWRDDPARRIEVSEKRLNSQLCDFLDSCAKRFFPMARFKHEEPQSGHHSIDLSAKPAAPIVLDAKQYNIYDSILVIECKRLPAPSSDREKEYVTGGKDRKSGGIQRFKLGLHGATLDIVAMIGYVQERSLSDWHREINGWIAKLCSGEAEDGCVWNEDETLAPLAADAARRVASYRSACPSSPRPRLE